MAAAAQPQGDESPKKRRPVPQGIEVREYVVSRESGLNSSLTTFGVGNRFQSNEKVVGRGRDSPNGREFYLRNPLWKTSMEVGKQCTQGIGARQELFDKSSSRKVGPGSYNIVASAAYPKSPLDGPEFCTTSIHKKLPSKLVPVDMCSPGPHHTYEVRRPLDHHLPGYGRQNLSYGSRHPPPEDTDGPGIGYAHHETKSLAKSTSSPGLSSGAGEPGGTKRCVKSTFGTADRFRTAKQSCSPVGDMYYAHSKILDAEDYMSASKTCGMGGGSKTDFSNPYKGHRLAVSPVTYRPVASTAKKTSAFDGLIKRSESPTIAYCRSMGCSTRSRSSPTTPAVGRKAAQRTPAAGKGVSSSLADTGTAAPSPPVATDAGEPTA
eukprot:gb/GFBE01015732.1/.p1 GENE.gb/GFBE01015732.1/~~gb/GFBE01015732.1/.p1  ORF type:complete len:378 (+),score=41.55 gb/GFBE01015732.1/:1-1134(+)